MTTSTSETSCVRHKWPDLAKFMLVIIIAIIKIFHNRVKCNMYKCFTDERQFLPEPIATIIELQTGPTETCRK